MNSHTNALVTFSLYNEILLKVEIFKYLDEPISIILTDRAWHSISKDSYTRANWLIRKYGKANAFFHAVRLGSNFISPDVEGLRVVGRLTPYD